MSRSASKSTHNPYKAPSSMETVPDRNSQDGWKFLLLGVSALVVNNCVVAYVMLIRMPRALLFHAENNIAVSANLAAVLAIFHFFSSYGLPITLVALAPLLYSEFRFKSTQRNRMRYHFGISLMIISSSLTAWILASVMVLM